MKFLRQVILSLSLLLLVVPLLAVESSSSDNNLINNITRGSSLSSNDTSPYWLSPSCNLAFGFYLLPDFNDRYVVGIWFVKSPLQTLVWTANPNGHPLHKSSSIHFTNEGKFMLRMMPENNDKLLLPDVPEAASYAKMHDDGNFVLYGSESQIIWESFDYPTDTLLGGQKLKAGIDLFSSNHRLSVRQDDGLVAIHPGTKISLPKQESTTRKRMWMYFEEGCSESYIYRATLDSEGIFNLYKERIDGSTDHNGESASILVLLWKNNQVDHAAVRRLRVIVIIVGIIELLIFFPLIIKWRNKAEKEKSKGGDLESGKTY
ncbi:G-type lectin S-receptor-like serine/threonine-protein kinase LECRK1 [Papaver somniferum]|uniref:G-type lectin S-receptor-like serine/threonine-protein kinase LECRK1 n=1 Tax=Papaver somniferum TaxID=3469 RepID=UPI000E6F85D6|nr:G-type lectin S-receptor-like serine/threonine-protein kinase LECRK1 [Papaver somniferum]